MGQSLFNVSVYAKDARAQALPLLGGEDTLHDWNYILGKLGILRWDQAVGNLIYMTGLVALAMSALGSFYFSREEVSAPGKKCKRILHSWRFPTSLAPQLVITSLRQFRPMNPSH